MLLSWSNTKWVAVSVCLFVFFFGRGWTGPHNSPLLQALSPRPFPYCTSTTLSSFYLFLQVDVLVCLFIGVRLLHSTRRVPGGLGWVSNPSQLSHVQNVLLSLWGDAGKLFKFVGVVNVQFRHLLIDTAIRKVHSFLRKIFITAKEGNFYQNVANAWQNVFDNRQHCKGAMATPFLRLTIFFFLLISKWKKLFLLFS